MAARNIKVVEMMRDIEAACDRHGQMRMQVRAYLEKDGWIERPLTGEGLIYGNGSCGVQRFGPAGEGV